jgi:hypothetical protein
VSGNESWHPGHVSGWLSGGRAGSASPSVALARSERTLEVECDEAQVVRLMAAAAVAQGNPATYAGGQACGTAGGGALR